MGSWEPEEAAASTRCKAAAASRRGMRRWRRRPSCRRMEVEEAATYSAGADLLTWARER
jgi:hypothetical protein